MHLQPNTRLFSVCSGPDLLRSTVQAEVAKKQKQKNYLHDNLFYFWTIHWLSPTFYPYKVWISSLGPEVIKGMGLPFLPILPKTPLMKQRPYSDMCHVLLSFPCTRSQWCHVQTWQSTLMWPDTLSSPKGRENIKHWTIGANSIFPAQVTYTESHCDQPNLGEILSLGTGSTVETIIGLWVKINKHVPFGFFFFSFFSKPSSRLKR